MTLKKNRSVMDLVRWNADRLQSRLGKSDLRRLDEHFTQIREMERRIGQIAEISPAVATAGCARLPDPGADPSSATFAAGEYHTERMVGYSDEHKRALVMGDLVYLALACDHTRAVAWMFTYPMCFMTVEPIIGNRKLDLHDVSHAGGRTAAADMARAVSWHVEHLARLADRLRKTREGTGNLLDSTVIVFLCEGGTAAEPHSSDGSCVVVGGGKAGGLVQGTHIDGRGRHHAQVLVSAMQACGVAAGALGEVNGRIDELHT
jgi:hypothetical protein